MKVSASRSLLRSSIASRRAGTSLIEMMVTISMLAMLMSFGVVLLGLMLRSDTAGHEAVAVQLSIERLARQFRADAHQTRNAAVQGEKGDTLRLTLDNDAEVVWTAAGPVVQREVRRDNSAVAHEAYHVPDGETVLSIEEDGRCLRLQQRQSFAPLVDDVVDERPRPQRELQIVAAVGIGRVATPEAPLPGDAAGGTN